MSRLDIIWNKWQTDLNMGIGKGKFKELYKEILQKTQECCHKGVSKSYCYNNIGRAYKHLAGHKGTDADQKVFNDRFEEIETMEIGREECVKYFKEKGGYGQEYRDVLNFCVCMGLIEKTVKIKDLKPVHYFKRIDGVKCEFLNKQTEINGKVKDKNMCSTQDFIETVQYIKQDE